MKELKKAVASPEGLVTSREQALMLLLSLRACGVAVPFFQGVKRFIPITSVRSIAGVYDWLEQVLAGQILNAAYNLPSTTNAIPLANPGALLLLTRVNLECQTFEKCESYVNYFFIAPVFNWRFRSSDFGADASR